MLVWQDFTHPLWSSLIAIFLFSLSILGLEVPNTPCVDSDGPIAMMGCWAWTKEYFIPIYAASIAILAFAVPLCNNVFSKLRGEESSAYGNEIVPLVYKFVHMRTVIVLNIVFLGLGGIWILVSGLSLMEEVKAPLFEIQLLLLMLWILVLFHFSVLSVKMFQLFKDSFDHIGRWILPYLKESFFQRKYSKIYFRLHREELIRRVQQSYSSDDFESDIDEYVDKYASPYIQRTNKEKSLTDSNMDLSNFAWEALEAAAEKILENPAQKVRFYRKTVMSFYRMYFINIEFLNSENRRSILASLYGLASTILHAQNMPNRETYLAHTFMAIEHILGRPVAQRNKQIELEESNSGQIFIEEFRKNTLMYLHSFQRSTKLYVDAARLSLPLSDVCKDHILATSKCLDRACSLNTSSSATFVSEASLWLIDYKSIDHLIENDLAKAQEICLFAIKHTYEEYLIFLCVFLRDKGQKDYAEAVESWVTSDPTLSFTNTEKLLQRPEKILATTFRLILSKDGISTSHAGEWFNRVDLEPSWSASIPSRGALAYWIKDIASYYPSLIQILNNAFQHKSLHPKWKEALITQPKIYDRNNYGRIHSFVENLVKNGSDSSKAAASQILTELEGRQRNELDQAVIDPSILKKTLDWFWDGFGHSNIFDILFQRSRKSRKALDTTFVFKLVKVHKNSFLPDNHPLKPYSANEEDFYKEVGEKAKFSLLTNFALSPIYKVATKVNTPNADIFWESFKGALAKIRENDLTPLVLCGNITTPLWWYDWVDEYGGLNRFRKPDDLVIQPIKRDDQYEATYYWIINGAQTISLPSIANGEFLIFPAEILEEITVAKPRIADLLSSEDVKSRPHDLTLSFNIGYIIKLKNEIMHPNFVTVIISPVDDI